MHIPLKIGFLSEPLFQCVSNIHKDTKTHTHTRQDTQHTPGASSLTHPYKYILLFTRCAHSSYFYYTEWVIHWYQKSTFHNDFSFQILFIHLLKPYLLIRCCNTRFFWWNTNNTNRNGVNKQNMKIVNMKISDTPPYFTNLSLFMEKNQPPFFSKILKTPPPLSPSLIKGVSNYECTNCQNHSSGSFHPNKKSPPVKFLIPPPTHTHRHTLLWQTLDTDIKQIAK